MADYNSTNTGAVIDTAVDAVELAQAATSTDATTNRLLKVGDFGLGSNSAPVISDFTLAVRSGHYRCLLSTAVGGPDSEAYNASVFVQNGISGAGSTFVVTRATSSTTGQAIYFGSRSSSSGTVVWQEYWHSRNLIKTTNATDNTAGSILKVGDFGVGGVSTVTSSGNLDDIFVNGIYGINTGSISGKPDASTLGSMLVVNYSTSTTSFRCTQTYFNLLGKVFIRTNAGVSWTDWYEVASEENDALITFGSNSNGSFTRFPDGTMIVRSSAVTSLSASETNWSFPYGFVALPEVTGLSSSTSAQSFALRTSTQSNTSVNFSVFTSANARIATGTRLTAIGRWK
jgi:hypothetical protein